MIARLTGKIEALSGPLVTIDVHGVGYEVSCSQGCTDKLEVGKNTTLVVYTDVREDSIRLFGFADELEKQVFVLLTQVKGVGAKTASDIISRIDKVELLKIIASADLAQLQSVKGIGKKTAERIIVELKDRVENYLIDQRSTRSLTEQVTLEPYGEALEALLALGFARRDAERALTQARKQASADQMSSSALVKEALRFV